MSYRVFPLFDRRPEKDPDPGAAVDYHQAHRVTRVETGQAVASIEPLKEGEGDSPDGFVIDNPEDIFTSSVELAEEKGRKLVVRSRKAGFPALENGKISIHDFLSIAGDVNFRTGNIDCPGDVVIKGSIMAGFKVSAANLTVAGNIENARIECSENLICHGGIVACQEYPLVCDGSLWCKYLENSHIEAKKNVFIAKSSLHSTIRAGGNITLCHKDSVLVGGRSEAGNSLYSEILGAKWATPTEVILGCDPFLAKELDQARSRLEEVESEFNQLRERIEQINIFLQHEDGEVIPAEAHRLQEERELTENKLGYLKTKLDQARQDCLAIEEKISAFKRANSDCRLQITSRIFSGVQLTIRDAAIRIEDESGAITLVNPPDSDEIVTEGAETSLTPPDQTQQ